MNIRVILVVLASVVCGGLASAQENQAAEECPFSFEASYVGDVVSNFSGGLKRGTVYLGLLNVQSTFETQKAGLWSNGLFHLNFGNTHGGRPSELLVGDFQGVSNIEAGNLTFLYELWYAQHVGQFVLTAGLQDLNVDFASSDCGGLFTNSSFGIQSSISDNISSPIFPLTALGLNVKWEVPGVLSAKFALFDGTPDDYENNPYNVHWRLSASQGYLAVSEFDVNASLVAGRAGTYKIGAYFHSHSDSLNLESDRNGGIYVVADQQVTDNISLFSQIGVSPAKNNNNAYCSVGVTCGRVFGGSPEDELGFALAYSRIQSAAFGGELAMELAYRKKLNEYMYVKPDLQYVINPAGTDMKLKNALVGFVRFGVEF